MFPHAALAQDPAEENKGLDPLSQLREINVRITGDHFNYSRDQGTLVIEGNVIVAFKDFYIRCDSLEVTTDEGGNPILHASPKVEVNYLDGLAELNSGAFYYDFNKSEGGFGAVQGIFHLDPDRIDVDLEVPQDVNFKADSMLLYPDKLVLKRPWWSLGRGEKSDFMFYSLEVQLNLEDNRIVSAEVDRFVVRAFGIKITLLPVRLRHGFAKHRGVGVTGFLPSVNYDEHDGLGIDQKLFYTFLTTPDTETYLSFRINPYLFNRYFWQIGLNYEFPDGLISVIYGPERQKDIFDDTQVVWSQPDVRFQYDLPRIGDWNHDLELYYGDIREASRDIERKRYGFDYSVNLRPIEYGRMTVKIGGGFMRNFYDGGDDYWVFSRSVAVSYDAGRDLDFKVTYSQHDEGGTSPFLYDRIKVKNGLGFKTQAFFSDRWGIRADTLYDLDKEHFERLGFGPIWISESFQVGLLWDFEGKMIIFTAGLPKQFN